MPYSCRGMGCFFSEENTEKKVRTPVPFLPGQGFVNLAAQRVGSGATPLNRAAYWQRRHAAKPRSVSG